MKQSLTALLALLLAVVPASEAGAAQSDSSQRSLLTSVRLGQLRVLAELERSIPADALVEVKNLRGYDLADKLDEIGRSSRTVEFMIRCSEVMLDPSLMELARSLSTPELFATVDPSLVAKIERLAALLEESFDVVGSVQLEWQDYEREALSKEIVNVFAQTVALLEDRDRPVAERRLWRHYLRGVSAMFCMAGRPTAVDLQSELLEHAIVGNESVLRMIAGAANGEQRARIVALGLTPVDRGEFDRRAEQLASARKALEEAQEALPAFQLPPDPAILKGHQD